MTLKNTRRIVAGVIAAAALPIAAAGSAQAHTSSGCTINPLTPEYAYTQSNGPGAQLQDLGLQDGWPNPDDHLGTSTFTASGVTTLNNYYTLVDGELGQEEV